MIAVRSGQNESLERINEMYKNDDATKEDYTNALRYIKNIWTRLRVLVREEDCRYYIVVTRKRKY